MGLLMSVLERVEFLERASFNVRMDFLGAGRCTELPAGHRIWSAGAPPQGLVVSISGTLRQVVRTPEGRELTLRIEGPGECVGTTSALTRTPQASDAEVFRGGEFLCIPEDRLNGFLEKHPRVREDMYVAVAHSLRRSEHDRAEALLSPIRQRIAALLLAHSCRRQGNGARVLLNMNRNEMATLLGTAREVVSRHLTDMKSRGLLEFHGPVIYVSDWDGLLEEAGAWTEDAAEFANSDLTPVERTARYFLPLCDRHGRRTCGILPCSAVLPEWQRCPSQACPGAGVGEHAREDRFVAGGATA